MPFEFLIPSCKCNYFLLSIEIVQLSHASLNTFTASNESPHLLLGFCPTLCFFHLCFFSASTLLYVFPHTWHLNSGGFAKVRCFCRLCLAKLPFLYCPLNTWSQRSHESRGKEGIHNWVWLSLRDPIRHFSDDSWFPNSSDTRGASGVGALEGKTAKCCCSLLTTASWLPLHSFEVGEIRRAPFRGVSCSCEALSKIYDTISQAERPSTCLQNGAAVRPDVALCGGRDEGSKSTKRGQGRSECWFDRTYHKIQRLDDHLTVNWAAGVGAPCCPEIKQSCWPISLAPWDPE